MDIGTIIIGLITITLCIIPFFLMKKSRKLKEKHLLNGLIALADSYQCELGKHDVSFDFAIGLSVANNYLFFYKHRNEIKIEESIPLDAIVGCRVESKTRTIKPGKSRVTVYDKLELVFVPQGGQTPLTKLVFFHADEHFQLNGQLQLLQEWESRINDALKTRKFAST